MRKGESEGMKSETLMPARAEKVRHDENARAQEALRISEALNRDLVENSAYGIFRVSADGLFLDGNPTLLCIAGCASAEDLLALNLARDIFRRLVREMLEPHAESCRPGSRANSTP